MSCTVGSTDVVQLLQPGAGSSKRYGVTMSPGFPLGTDGIPEGPGEQIPLGHRPDPTVLQVEAPKLSPLCEGWGWQCQLDNSKGLFP